MTRRLATTGLRAITDRNLSVLKRKCLSVEAHAHAHGGHVVSFYSVLAKKGTNRPSHRLYAQLSCNCGHTWSSQVQQLLHLKTWCKQCRYIGRRGTVNSAALARIRNRLVSIVTEKGGRLVTPLEHIKTNEDEITVYCQDLDGNGEEHGEFIVTIPNLLRGRGSEKKGRGAWCSKCKFEHLSSLYLKPFLTAKKEIESFGWRVLSTEDEYSGADSKLRAICTNGHENVKSVTKYLSGGGCKACSTGIGRGEEVCRLFFQYIFGKSFPKSRPSFLEGLEFDGYCEELGMAFEYDGPHHVGRKIFGRNPKYQMERDSRKDFLAHKNGVTLVRVPWIEEDWTLGRWINRIESAIADSKISIVDMTYEGFDPIRLTTQRDDLARIEQVEKRLNVRCLDGDVYRGGDHKYQWQCGCGNLFSTSLYALEHKRTNFGCKACVMKSKRGIKRPLSSGASSSCYRNLRERCTKIGYELLDQSWKDAKAQYRVRCVECDTEKLLYYRNLVGKNAYRCKCVSVIKAAEARAKAAETRVKSMAPAAIQRFERICATAGYILIDRNWRGARVAYTIRCSNCGLEKQLQPSYSRIGKCTCAK